MLKFIGAVLTLCWAGQVSAQSCPDFFRFVDFGLEDNTGTFSRGGPLLRAESLEGTPLLLRERTICRKVRDIASDGHGNPIPVVTRVSYNPAKTELGLTELQVSFAANTTITTDQNTRAHLARLDRAGTEVARGQDHLCVFDKTGDEISCQLISPYPGNLALVIYCDYTHCVMPALAMNDRMQISARWSFSDDILRKPETVGPEMMIMVKDIHAFLEPLM